MEPFISDKKPLYQLYFRYCQWSNHLFASFAGLLATVSLLIARFLPRNTRHHAYAFAQLLKNFALIIRRPRYAYMWMSWSITGKALVDTIILSIPLLWYSYLMGYVTDHSPLAHPGIVHLLAWSGIFIFTLICCLFASIAFVSGDAYALEQDEFQVSAANETAMFTLRITSILLVLLFFGYLFMASWREVAFLHVSMLLFIARLLYIIKLIQLRWQDLTAPDVEENTRLSLLK